MPTTTYTIQTSTRQHPYLWLYAGLALWFSLIAAMAVNQTFITAPGSIPWPTIAAVLAPVSLYLVAYNTNGAFRNFVLGFDQRILILLHSWRVIGFGFVFLYFYDILPGLFALPAGIGDTVAAILALLLATSIFLGHKVSKNRILLWNYFGLLDFVVAVTAGVLTGALGLTDISSRAMGYFPLAVIPCFFVPAYVITHIIIFQQLKNKH